MRLQAALFSFAASVAFCQTINPGGSDLVDVLLSDPDTQGFGQLLAQFPDLVTNLDPTKNYTVFAPSNQAVAEFRQNFGINASLTTRPNSLHRRDIEDYVAAIALLFTDSANQANLNTQPTDLITNLTDPEFINIVPPPASASLTLSSTSPPASSAAEPSSSSTVLPTTSLESSASSSTPPPSTSEPLPSSSVPPPESTLPPTSAVVPPASTEPPPASSAAAPPPPPPNAGCVGIPPKVDVKRSLYPYSPHVRRQLNGSTILVSSGFGKLAAASLSETPYKSGGVRKVDSFFTLFGDLASTLQQTNGTAFADALTKAGTLDSLSATPRITVFVPNDAILQGKTLDAEALKQYVLPDNLVTTPRLKAGLYKTSSGDSVNVTSNPDGSISVNNATIVKSDVLIKNGVIHYIDSVYTGTFTGSASGFKIPTVAILIALLVSSASMF